MDSKLIKKTVIALLEFKCPASRKPIDDIPKHYIPQLWSGLAVSNIASIGLFVDSVFRKCSLDVLSNNEHYDTIYHRRDTYSWGLPIAWGLVGVYSPIKPTIINDLGKVPFTNFNTVLEQINLKNFLTKRSIPWFSDGRGCKKNMFDVMEDMSMNGYTIHPVTNKKLYLMGFIPWKLFYVSYIPIHRRINFLNEIKPLIEQLHIAVLANKV